MSSVGQTLREAREARGLTLQDLQEKTKIQPRYLKAIEEDRFDALPGHFYTRAFIRTYAEHIGIDPQPLLSELKDPEGDELESVQEIQHLSRRANREREPSFSLAKWFSRALLILFLVLVGTVIYNFVDGANMGLDLFSGTNNEGPEQTGSDNSGNGEGNDPLDEAAPEDDGVEPTVTVEQTGEQGSTIYYEVSGVDELEMDVKANAHVWFEVRDGDSSGEVLTSKEVSEGHSEQFTSDKGLYIRIGNTRGVNLVVNETDISTDYGQPRNFVFALKTDE